jgi:hypothetical protein
VNKIGKNRSAESADMTTQWRDLFQAAFHYSGIQKSDVTTITNKATKPIEIRRFTALAVMSQ